MGQQVLDGDRQFAGPVAGGVVHRVGDRGGGADLPDFPDALDAERAGDVVLDFDQLDVDVGRVGVDGDEVVAQAQRPWRVSMRVPSSRACSCPRACRP